MKLILANRLTATRALRIAGLAIFFASASALAGAQVYQPPPPPLTSAPCVPTKKDPCTQPDVTPAIPATVEKFPFPGDAPATAGQPSTPAASTPPGSTTPPAFPFPGEPQAPAATAHPFPGEPAEPADSSSSSSSSSSNSQPDSSTSPDSPDKPALKDQGSSGSTRFQRRHLPRNVDLDNREEQDLQVSKYYASTGDYKAAYLRAKDAVATVPADPEAHYLLGDAARHYGKLEEARAELEAYLKLDPDGEHTKSARAALLQLAPK